MAGPYFIDASVEAGAAALAGAVDPTAGLSWVECAQAQPVTVDLSALGMIALFYPSSDAPRFTRFAAGTARDTDLLLAPAAGASVTVCAGCDPSRCFPVGPGMPLGPLLSDSVLQLDPSPAVTARIDFR
jgi:hypothetical protein